MEGKRKMESLLQELKRKLEEEQNKMTRELNNNQQVNDKINNLQRQVCASFIIFLKLVTSNL